ncbi:hypothetical protein WZ76_04400 [Shouchella clausii]|nr:hypothetical protein WZ76_04400 [Shouchella clausii]
MFLNPHPFFGGQCGGCGGGKPRNRLAMFMTSCEWFAIVYANIAYLRAPRKASYKKRLSGKAVIDDCTGKR